MSISKEPPIDTGSDLEDSPIEDSVADEVNSVERGSVRVLPFEEQGADESMTIQTNSANSKNSWLPWKRPNRRDQQLRHLREGYIELLGLVRSISDHLDRQKDEESQVSTLVESLPPALNSFEKLASSQKEVTAILGNLNTHMEKTSEKDEQLLENLSGFNSTLQDVSSSHEKSLGTLDKVSERIENSDEQMKTLFQQANRNNEAAGSLMVRLEKRVFLSNMALVALLSLILLLAMIWVVKNQNIAPLASAPAPVTVNSDVAENPRLVPANEATPELESNSLSPVVQQEIVPEVEVSAPEASVPDAQEPTRTVVAPVMTPPAGQIETSEAPEAPVPAASDAELGIEASEVDEIIEDLDLFEYS